MHIKSALFRLFFAILLVSLVVPACRKDTPDSSTTSSYGSEVPQAYYKLALKLTKEGPGFTPPVAARAFGYVGLALYESVVPGMPRYQSLQGQVSGFPTGTLPVPENGLEYNWEISANAAMANILKLLYRNATVANLAAIDSLEKAFAADLQNGVDAAVVNRSKFFGQQVAYEISLYAASDGQEFCYANNFPASFVPPVGPGKWVPTPPAFQPALQPYWGNVRTFVPASTTNTQPPNHPPYSTNPNSKFYKEAKEVFDVLNALTPAQKLIAEFWSDDPGKTATPPGHSISLGIQVLEQEKANLELTAEIMAKIGMGVHDAFVSCWKCKYDFNLLRPVTFIREHFQADWNSVLTTPPFPEYTSGHSVQSGATAQILTSAFGNAYLFTDKTHAGRTDIDGSPRQFRSFFEMADEAAISRLYGGIHFRTAIDLGIEQGKAVGVQVLSLKFKK